MAKRLFAVQTLIENDANAPYVHLGGDLGRVLADDKALGRKIPVCEHREKRVALIKKRNTHNVRE